MIKQTLTRHQPDVCRADGFDGASVARFRSLLEDLPVLSDVFRALADETRARIVYCLAHQELCACDLAEIFQVSRPAIAHHLRVLRELKLVRSRREGKFVFYTIDDEHVRRLITDTVEHLQEGR